MKYLGLLCALFVFTPAALGQPIGDLSSLATLSPRTSHRASSYDTTGGNVDNVTSFAPGDVHTILDCDGPGKITHLWLTVSEFDGHAYPLRDLVIRIYWEGSEVPSVEAPLGDFFGLGHGKMYRVESAPINVGDNLKALNCYWPMPFYKHARIELVNNGDRSIRRIYYNLDYELGAIAGGQGLFHVQYLRQAELLPQPLEGNTHGKENYVLLDTEGSGHYMGCFLFVDSAPGGWWGEGDEMMFIDGEQKPSIVGTGTEDYFCNAWGFARVANFPYYGVPYLQQQPDRWKQTTAYRLHVPDPVRFRKSIRVTLEHTWHGDKPYDYSSIAYWYQSEPATRRVALPAGSDNWPRSHEVKKPEPANRQICATTLEPELRHTGAPFQVKTTGHREAFGGGVIEVDPSGKFIELPFAGIAPGRYQATANFRATGSPLEVRLPDGSVTKANSASRDVLQARLGTVEVGEDGRLVVSVRSSGTVVADSLLLKLDPSAE